MCSSDLSPTTTTAASPPPPRPPPGPPKPPPPYTLAGSQMMGPLSPNDSPTGTIRHYYIAAEELPWSFVPMGNLNLGAGIALPSPYTQNYVKTRLIGYTDASFKTRSPQPAWLGICGPVLRAQVSELLE